MSIRFNDKLMLWGLGVIQPATAMEVIAFLRLVYPDVETWPDEELLEGIIRDWIARRYIVEINKKYGIYSLTTTGNQAMDYRLRMHRDKARVILLRSVYDASLKKSEVVVQDLDGVAPSSEARTVIQEGSRPVNSGSEPSRLESTRLRARIYWPRVSEQLGIKVGLEYHASDIPSFKYRYYSFPTLSAIKSASNDISDTQDLSIVQLGLCIGISPRLLTSFTHKPENHYRTFHIEKKSGGEREISSPRFFLKSVQYWIKTYILPQLKIHSSCHAFLIGKSIISNASLHLQKSYVGNIDIDSFFGSITKDMIIELLKVNGYGPRLSTSIANLVTYKGVLPQGAPTSPSISNAILYEFDQDISQISRKKNLVYTRYADDITISGNSREDILSVIEECSIKLRSLGMALNENKTRIASSRSSQIVTGLVVNEKIQPPRKLLRKIRAMFHNAHNHPAQYSGRIAQLNGYLSYLRSFDALEGSKHLSRYQSTLRKLQATQLEGKRDSHEY